MILKRRVALDGQQLDELDDRIIITGIDEAAGKDNITAVARAGNCGQRVIRTRRDSLDVTVKFALNIKNNKMGTREVLLEEINGWAANGGLLTLSKRGGRQLYVMLAQAPGPGDMFNWTNEYTMVFRAFAVPYWEDKNATSYTVGDKVKSGSVRAEIPGNVTTVMDVSVKNASGKEINEVNITAGGSEINFTNLGLGGSETLQISHVQDAGRFYFRARIGSRSVLKYRTGADDLYVEPGKRTISFSADRAVTVKATVRGRYL